MNRFLTAAALALTIGVSTVPAFAYTLDKVAAEDIVTHVTKFTENANPQFGCADPMDKTLKARPLRFERDRRERGLLSKEVYPREPLLALTPRASTTPFAVAQTVISKVRS